MAWQCGKVPLISRLLCIKRRGKHETLIARSIYISFQVIQYCFCMQLQACMASFAAFFAFSLLVALHFCCCHGQDDGTIAAIYSFGDSISDTGNMIKEAPPGVFWPSNHLPYGITLGYPTGRCSDGLLMIDFLAQDLGLPFLNPYLGKNKSFDHGVNFAVAGATAMDPADQFNRGFFMPFSANSLKLQLRWFKDFMKSSFATDEDIRKRLQSSLVLIGEIGGNDYNFAFVGNTTVNEVEKLVPGVVQTIIDAAKEVLDMGANRVIVPGNFPIGCLPSYLTMKGSSEPSDYDSVGCLKELNLLAVKHNWRLQQAVADLWWSHPNAYIAYADYFNSFFSLLKGASSLGFDASSTLKACCGAGGKYNFDWRMMCGGGGTTACAEPSAYVSWDGLHMTQAAYKAMSRLVYHGRFLQPQILNFPEKDGQT